MNRIFLTCLTCSFFAACSTTRFVKPLEKDQFSVGFDFGGPMINFAGAKIPLPRTSLTVGYGATDRCTAWGSLHTTDAAFGTIHLEGGAMYDIIPAKGLVPGLSASGSAHFMVDVHKGKFRAFPQIDINGYWNYYRNDNKKLDFTLYLSANNWFDFWTKRAHNEKSAASLYTPAFCLGNSFGFKRTVISLEAKYIAPFTPNRDMVVTYNGSGGRGSWGIFLGVNYRFFKPQKKG